MKNFIYVFIFILIGCTSRQKQVLFTDLQYAHEGHSEEVVRVYIDKRGSFYPKKEIYIAYNDFYDKKAYKDTYTIAENTGSLKDYFIRENEKLIELASAYGISTVKDTGNTFQKAQKKIVQEKAGEIRKLLSAPDSELVVLIHGFNDANPSGDYYLMRKYIQAYKPDINFVFLEVYWDGLTANQGSPGFSGIWSYAQMNSSFVANAIRRLLNDLDEEVRIRLITHSLGASVGTGALFNTSSKWKNAEKEPYYKDMMGIHAPVHRDIRIGMIAPAIPGVMTFVDFNRRKDTRTHENDTILPAENNISRVVIGYKETDEALHKKALKKSKFLSKQAGATTLGSNPETKGKSEIERVYEVMNTRGYPQGNTPIDTVNFISKENYKNEHGLYYYMKNEKSLKLFLDKLFD